MRIALFNNHASVEGGIEVYLKRLIPLLQTAGHEVALLHLHPPQPGRETIAPAGLTSWCVDTLGAESTFGSLCGWRPDVVYCQSVPPAGPLEGMAGNAPLIFFAHAYAGSCISGAKAFKQPVRQPCHRQFGLGCLLLFYPRRCGGLNPLTMLADYRRQQNILAWLRRAACIATHSAVMREEFLRHGFPTNRVKEIPFLVPREAPLPPPHKSPSPDGPLRLLFLGRFDSCKGGDILLRALPTVQQRLGKSLSVTFAGDGPERVAWESLATASGREALLDIQFTGWIDAGQRTALLAESDLLVVPSLWPEPFGQVGVEAGWAGVPSVAFDVGGIRAWLTPGVNGHLAPGDPPTVEGLAEAMVSALQSPAEHARLCEGARALAERFSAEQHLSALENLFQGAIKASARMAGHTT